uniref:NADH-ubiquinone oxidoreductase chain 4L n=1 Tax=Paranurophorus simplex TaxID=2583953 RepID=A0A6H0EW76_9HEXA|nr:NADH dehydrogenase subunit 4L [Paranurophorus simplex]
MKMLTLLIFMVWFSGLWIFSSKRDHLLSLLLSIEYISLGTFFIFIISFFFSDLFFGLMFIIITACEGALGLSILINMTRTHSGDYIKNMNLITIL